jgi:tagaturonate epimerase
MQIEKYSFGIGDRFAKEGKAQLSAIQEINKLGVAVVPVWNKSKREHTIVNTSPGSVADEAANAVSELDWKHSFYIDADHIGLDTVDSFIDYSNFFTIDVAHFIARPAEALAKAEFVMRHSKYLGELNIPGIPVKFKVTKEYLNSVADNYLLSIQEVKKIYDHIVVKKGAGRFIPEVSMDECANPQTPLDLFFILAEFKYQEVELQTIAPKFSGIFAKGVDYIGDLAQFAKEFEQDVAVTKYASEVLNLPSNLKLSVHSGSDKFSIYPAIRSAIEKFDVGIHIKTAGTTWLEEVIGMAQGGSEGLSIAKKIYSGSLKRYDQLTAPYSTVLCIDKSKLPSVEIVEKWNSAKFSESLIHNKNSANYNPNFRQLIHVGYKIAAELGEEYITALDKYRENIEKNVSFNILERHLKHLFYNSFAPRLRSRKK